MNWARLGRQMNVWTDRQDPILLSPNQLKIIKDNFKKYTPQADNPTCARKPQEDTVPPLPCLYYHVITKVIKLIDMYQLHSTPVYILPLALRLTQPDHSICTRSLQ